MMYNDNADRKIWPFKRLLLQITSYSGQRSQTLSPKYALKTNPAWRNILFQAIFDATNTTRERRATVYERIVHQHGLKCMFLESICNRWLFICSRFFQFLFNVLFVCADKSMIPSWQFGWHLVKSVVKVRCAKCQSGVWEGVRSRYSLSPERRKNSWQLYFNPRHQYLITRVFLGPIAFRIYITLICAKCT